jgi:nucleoside-diphosphate-sugar epimerase
MSRAFVTGASGFIGANLVRALVGSGDEAHVLVRPSTDLRRLNDVLPRMHLHIGSLSDTGKLTDLIRQIEPATVFHLAAASGHPRTRGARVDALRTDAMGTLNVLHSIGGRVEHLVYLGSNLEYGYVRGAVPEDAPVRPSSFRGVAKAASTMLVQHFSVAEEQPTTIIRPFHVYGAWESPGRVIPTFVRALLRGRDIAVAPAGYGRDFVFVDDLVDACLRAPAAARSPAQVFNVGSGALTTIEELVMTLSAVVGAAPKYLPERYSVAAWDEGAMFADIAKAAELLSWRPRHTLLEGLTRTVRWWNDELGSVCSA